MEVTSIIVVSLYLCKLCNTCVYKRVAGVYLGPMVPLISLLSQFREVQNYLFTSTATATCHQFVLLSAQNMLKILKMILK